MLHRVGSILFLLAIIMLFLKCSKFINKEFLLKLHIGIGTIGASAMILYSIIDFLKDGEITILPVGLASILIIISGTREIRKRCKWLHLMSVVGFAVALVFHIIN